MKIFLSAIENTTSSKNAGDIILAQWANISEEEFNKK